MRKTSHLIFAALVSVFVLASFSQAQTAAPTEVVKFLSRQAKAADAEEYPGARKIIRVDMNGDRKNDLVVLYTLEGFGGGNSYGQSIAVFLRKGNKYVFSANKTVGGKLTRSVELKRVSGRTIFLDTLHWGKDDGGCCPSIKGKTRFVFSKGRLREVA